MWTGLWYLNSTVVFIGLPWVTPVEKHLQLRVRLYRSYDEEKQKLLNNVERAIIFAGRAS